MNERFEDVAPDGRRISDVGGESALIEALASAMQSKLAKNRGKRHWQDAAPTYLIDRLRQEVEELEQAIGGYLEEGSADEDDVWNEAADVANFAAMLADNATGRSEARADSQERPQPALDVDGRKHGPRLPDQWIGCICGNNHRLSAFPLPASALLSTDTPEEPSDE